MPTPRSDYQTERRMAQKRAAIPLPPLSGKRVLDVGCDGGYWSRLASDMGAHDVLGLDRNRDVRGLGIVDLVAENRAMAYPRCRFERINLGKEWRDFGTFDVIFCFSVYHHIFENCGDHSAVWFWLWRHLADGGILLWESPLDDADGVIRANVSEQNRVNYSKRAILESALKLFESEYIGPARHAPHRHVIQFTKRKLTRHPYSARVVKGAGGVSKAFAFDHGRRINEIEAVLGMRAVAGSLNLRGDNAFNWNEHYLRARIGDVIDRKAGLASPWGPRWCRFYPLNLMTNKQAVSAFAMRFEGERYETNFVELIAPHSLREVCGLKTGDEVTLWTP